MCAMIIGLLSGREFIVQEKFYAFLGKDGSSTRIFVSLDKKRLITIPSDGSIEFFDEPSSDEAIAELEQALLGTANTLNKVEVDPNVG